VQSRIVHTPVWHAGLCLRALGRCTPGPVRDNPLRTRQPTRGAGPRTVKFHHAGIQLVTSRRAGIRLDARTSIGVVQCGRVRRSHDAPASRLVHPELRSEEPFRVRGFPSQCPTLAGIGYCEAMCLGLRKDRAMTTFAAIFLYTPAAPVALLCLAGLAIVVGLCSL